MNALVPAAMSSPVVMEFGQMERLAEAVAKSNLFGLKTKDQALVLMSIAQAEGMHPALAARDYDVIQGRPAKKAEAMLRDFLRAGGQVEWHELTDEKAEATFKHKQGGVVRISWDMTRAHQAGLKKEMYNKFPRQMLRSRCVSEGVRTVWPSATSGMYVPEEAITIDHEPQSQTVTLAYPPPTPTERAIGDRLPAHSAPEPSRPDVDESKIDAGIKDLVDRFSATDSIVSHHRLVTDKDVSRSIEWLKKHRQSRYKKELEPFISASFDRHKVRAPIENAPENDPETAQTLNFDEAVEAAS